MATLTATVPVITGVLLGATAAAGGGDKFLNDGRTVFYVKNGGGGSINVTVDAQSVEGLAITDIVVAVAAGAERLIGPFPPKFFNDATGFVNIAYSGVTTVTVIPIQVQG